MVNVRIAAICFVAGALAAPMASLAMPSHGRVQLASYQGGTRTGTGWGSNRSEALSSARSRASSACRRGEFVGFVSEECWEVGGGWRCSVIARCSS